MSWWTKYTEVQVELAIANALAGVSGIGTSSSDQLLFNASGSVSGNAKLLFSPDALPTASAPSVTTVGTPGATTYSYDVAWANAVGQGITGNPTSINTGNATLSGSNYNVIDPGVAPAGATHFYVYQETPNYGLVGVGTAGTPFHDVGDYPFRLTDGDGPFQPYGDSSVGLALTGVLRQADLGDQRPAAHFGTKVQDFPDDWQNFTYAPLYMSSAKFAFAWGTEASIFAQGPLVSINASAPSVSGALYVSNYRPTSGSSNVTAVEAEVGGLGTGGLGNAFYAFYGAPTISDASADAEYRGFYFHDVTAVNGATGTIGTVVGFDSSDQSTAATTLAAAFRSGFSAGANKYAFYGEGTAASHFGGDIDVAGFIAGIEQSEPAAPAANGYRIFAKDTGGKTELLVRFNSGASQQIAIEP